MATSPPTPSLVAGHDVRHDPTVSLGRYMNEFCYTLSARRFPAMRGSGDGQPVRDERHGRKCDTSVGPWKKRCWHCGVLSTLELSCYFFNIDSPNVCCLGEVGYE